MAVAIYGGTFDPFHKAHKALVKEVINLEDIETVYVIPAGLPPHKQEKTLSFAAYRYKMAELGVGSNPEVKLSAYEILKEEPSYTLETIEHFQNNVLHVNEEVYLLIGADSLLAFETWYEFENLLKLVSLLVVPRPGSDQDDVLAKANYLKEKYDAHIEFLDFSPLDYSASAIRAELLAGQETSLGLPKKLARFINRNRVYEHFKLLDLFSREQLAQLRAYEQQLWPLMSIDRLVHSVNVMFTAVSLAERFSLDIWPAAVAGLLHDLAKEENAQDYPEILAKLDITTKKNKAILHGPVGAGLAQERFGVEDEEVLHAIYVHSTLSKNPSDLDLLVYLADKIEPGRRYKGVEEIRQQAQTSIGKAVLLSIKGTKKALKRQGKKIHPWTKAAAKDLRKN